MSNSVILNVSHPTDIPVSDILSFDCLGITANPQRIFEHIQVFYKKDNHYYIVVLLTYCPNDPNKRLLYVVRNSNSFKGELLEVGVSEALLVMPRFEYFRANLLHEDGKSFTSDSECAENIKKHIKKIFT
jgi:hypothetical protein